MPRTTAASCVTGGGVLGTTARSTSRWPRTLDYAAGDRFAAFDTPVGRLGMMICYDKAFPEAARALALDGAEIVVCMSAWPAQPHQPGAACSRTTAGPGASTCSTRPGRWRTRSCGWRRTRPGRSATLASSGRAKVVGPGGDVLATTGTGPGMAVAARRRRRRAGRPPGGHGQPARPPPRRLPPRRVGAGVTRGADGDGRSSGRCDGADVVVVGGSVAGLMTALALAGGGSTSSWSRPTAPSGPGARPRWRPTRSANRPAHAAAGHPPGRPLPHVPRPVPRRCWPPRRPTCSTTCARPGAPSWRWPATAAGHRPGRHRHPADDDLVVIAARRTTFECGAAAGGRATPRDPDAAAAAGPRAGGRAHRRGGHRMRVGVDDGLVTARRLVVDATRPPHPDAGLAGRAGRRRSSTSGSSAASPTSPASTSAAPGAPDLPLDRGLHAPAARSTATRAWCSRPTTAPSR